MSYMVLSIPDIAVAFGVCTRTIRRWEQIGRIPKASRTLGGHRRWDSATLIPALVEGGYAVPASWNIGVAA